MKIGAKVKVTHNPAHDVKFYEEAQAARKANDGRVGTVMHLRGTLECPAFAVDTGSGVLACYEAAEGLDRVVTVARENAALWRADVDALQAAIQGLTGKGGTVASMVGDLADIARDMAALKAAVAKASEEATIALASEQSVRRGAIEARDVLDARLQVSARVATALRTILRDGDAMAVLRCLDDLDKALRGMPLGETRGRQGERFHAPVTRTEVAPDRPSRSLQDRLAEVERLVGGMPDHLAALDQRVAGLGNRLDEVRRPKVALVAGSNGSLEARCDRGEQVGGLTTSGGTFHWFARRPFAQPAGDTGVPTREEAIAAMTRALETWAEIQS